MVIGGACEQLRSNELTHLAQDNVLAISTGCSATRVRAWDAVAALTAAHDPGAASLTRAVSSQRRSLVAVPTT